MQSMAMTRTEMIDRLVALSVATATTETKHLWLKDMFENGFIGYSKFSDRRLLMELELRGMVPVEDAVCDDATDDADADILPLALAEESIEDIE